ncbi:hypothetical protein J3A83DRAFT_4437375 [Scleroderma citrinum]
MAIDEPLLRLSSLTASSLPWELPLQTPITIQQTVESLASSIDISGPSMEIAKSITGISTLTNIWCNITTPATTSISSSAPAFFASVGAAPAVQYPDAHERLMHINYKFSNNFNTTWMNTEHPTTQLEKAWQLALLSTDVSTPSPAPLDLAEDGSIIAAYDYYANTLVEARQQYQVLLERRTKLEAMREDLQDDNITSIGTQEIDNL